jgi:hypothetical protein
VAEQNRVTPFGEIVAVAQRGLVLGNRGCIHRDRAIVRPWQVRRWITCALEHKGWVAPKWEPGRWTALFFWDEAVALAAGHRPCALCRRAAFVRWMDTWEAATGARPKVDPIDRQLHQERTPTGRARVHTVAWASVPDGCFVVVDDLPALVIEDRVVPWTPASTGYDPSLTGNRLRKGVADVLTPPSIVDVLRHGYAPTIHPSARSS